MRPCTVNRRPPLTRAMAAPSPARPARGSTPTSTPGKCECRLECKLFSYALGESAMHKLRQAKVLISGLGGVGVEVAKNLILGGVRHVTLHDVKTVSWRDLAAQYYVKESDIGKNRAAACFAALEELNDSVQCTLSTDELTEAFVADFDVSSTPASILFLAGDLDGFVVRVPSRREQVDSQSRALFHLGGRPRSFFLLLRGPGREVPH